MRKPITVLSLPACMFAVKKCHFCEHSTGYHEEACSNFFPFQMSNAVKHCVSLYGHRRPHPQYHYTVRTDQLNDEWGHSSQTVCFQWYGLGSKLFSYNVSYSNIQINCPCHGLGSRTGSDRKQSDMVAAAYFISSAARNLSLFVKLYCASWGWQPLSQLVSWLQNIFPLKVDLRSAERPVWVTLEKQKWDDCWLLWLYLMVYGLGLNECCWPSKLTDCNNQCLLGTIALVSTYFQMPFAFPVVLAVVRITYNSNCVIKKPYKQQKLRLLLEVLVGRSREWSTFFSTRENLS